MLKFKAGDRVHAHNRLQQMDVVETGPGRLVLCEWRDKDGERQLKTFPESLLEFAVVPVDPGAKSL